MVQKLIQTQTQKLQQLQRLSAQQMLQVKLLEMPLTELEENIDAELDDNPALEKIEEEENFNEEAVTLSGDSDDMNNDEDFEMQNEREEREEALDSALESIGRDDEMPDYDNGHYNKQNADYEEIVYGDTTSFYDKLKEQMDMLELTDQDHDIMEYLIGSLDSDGILRKDLDSICDELAIYHNIDVDSAHIENILKRLQQFDPAGIGGRNLQECLLLQIQRLPQGKLADAMRTVIQEYFDDFTKKHWDKIKSGMQLSDTQVETLQDEIRKLNPKPGSSLGETEGRNIQQITPDFIVETNDDGSISFSLNNDSLPQLTISPSFSEMMDSLKNNKEGLNRQEKEALLYVKEKVDKAKGYIDAIRQRQHTLTITIKAIIEWQRKFFQDGDEADLRPMILKDIADKTNLDISTISRVSNVKYVQTKWGIYPLKFFFTDSYTTEDGEELSTRKIKIALKEIIENEDHQKPKSDETLASDMKEKGYPIARRTITKYREQLGIPVARLRRK